MEWSKLKNIILTLLAATNLCLLGFLFVRELKQAQQLREAREQALSFLASRNVAVEPDRVPDKMELIPQVVERSLEEEKKAAAALLDGEVRTERRTGDTYCYYNENGQVQIQSDGAFTARFSTGFLPLEKSRERTGRELLKRFGFEGEPLKAEDDKVTFHQLWNNVPLFDHQVTVCFDDRGVTGITAGRRLNGTPVPVQSGRPVTVATALIAFYNGLNELGDVCSRVDAIYQGYVSAAPLAGPDTLVPVWRIDTDTGRYQLSTMSGTLIRLS